MSDRTRRSQTLVVVVAIMGGLTSAVSCVRSDVDIPPTARFLCNDADACPDSWTCDVDVGLCVSPDAPRLDGAISVSVLFASAHRAVDVEVTFDRDVGESDASAALVDRAGIRAGAGALVHGGVDGRTHLFSLAPTDVAEGEYLVEITATSENGAGAVFRSSAIVIDHTPPTLAEGDDAVSITPSLVNDVADVSIVVTLSEIAGGVADGLPSPVVVLVASDGSTTRFDAVSFGPADVGSVWKSDDGAARVEGTTRVFIEGIRDRAGNPFASDAPVSVGDITVDFSPPTLAIESLSPAVVSPDSDDDTLFVCLTVSDVHLKTGEVSGPMSDRAFSLTVGNVDVTASCAAPSASCAGTHECTVDLATLTNADTPEEGPVLVGVVSTDAAGNTTSTAGAVIWDERAPTVLNPFSWVTGGDNNVVFNPAAVALGSTLHVAFNTDEAVRSRPTHDVLDEPVLTLSCPSGSVELVRVPPFSTTFFLYDVVLTVDDGVTDGLCAVTAVLKDIVGNVGSGDLEALPLIRIDVTTPPTDEIGIERLLHVRAPWGFTDDMTPGTSMLPPFQFLYDETAWETDNFGIPWATFQAPDDNIVMVRIWDTAVGGTEIGRSLPAVDDELEPYWAIYGFANRDSARIWLSIVDDAGNESDRLRVDRGMVFLSTGSRDTWDQGPSPVALFSSGAVSSALLPKDLTVLRFPDPLLDPNAASQSPDDDNTAAGAMLAGLAKKTGGPSFSRLGAAVPPTFAASGGVAWVSDARYGRAVSFGGVVGGELTNALHALNRAGVAPLCSNPFEPCYWQRPDRRMYAAAVVNTHTHDVVVSGGCARQQGVGLGCSVSQDFVTFDGTAFTGRTCVGPACASVLGRQRHSMVFERFGGSLVIAGGCTDENCQSLSSTIGVVDKDGNAFSLCTAQAPCLGAGPTQRAEAAAFIDDNDNTLYLAGGCRAYATGGATPTCIAPSGGLFSLALSTTPLTWTTLIADVDAAVSCDRTTVARRTVDPFSTTLGQLPVEKVLVACARTAQPLTLSHFDGTTLQPLLLDDREGDGAPTGADATIVFDPGLDDVFVISSSSVWKLVERDAGVFGLTKILDPLTPFAPNLDNPHLVASSDGTSLFVGEAPGFLATSETWRFNGGQFEKLCGGCGTLDSGGAMTYLDDGGNAGAVWLASGRTYGFDEGLLPGDPWLEKSFPGIPADLRQMTFVPQANGRDALLFGGHSATSGGVVDDLWRLSPTGYNAMSFGVTAPTARMASGGAFDPDRSAMVLFGGCANVTCTSPLSDTWFLTDDGGGGVDATVLTGGPSPPARGFPVMFFDDDRQHIAMFAGSNTYQTVEPDMWELDDNSWRVRHVVDPEGDGAPKSLPLGRHARDRLGNGEIVYAGSDNFGPEFWRYENGVGRRPGHILITALPSSVVPDNAHVANVGIRWAAGGTSSTTNGARLFGWYGDRWVPLAESATASSSSPELLTGVLDDVGHDPTTGDDPTVTLMLRSKDRSLAFMVVPPDNGTDDAELTSIYADVIVSYVLPVDDN